MLKQKTAQYIKGNCIACHMKLIGYNYQNYLNISKPMLAQSVSQSILRCVNHLMKWFNVSLFMVELD